MPNPLSQLVGDLANTTQIALREVSKREANERGIYDSKAVDAFGTGGAPSDKSAKAPPPLYKALVALKALHLSTDGERFDLGAGMQASAEILLGTRTVMEYLLSPLRKAWHEAGRER